MGSICITFIQKTFYPCMHEYVILHGQGYGHAYTSILVALTCMSMEMSSVESLNYIVLHIINA